jgi:hypothetical protein
MFHLSASIYRTPCFSGSKERHVAQKVKLLWACEHAAVFLAPFQRAEGWSHHYPSWKAIQVIHQTALPP